MNKAALAVTRYFRNLVAAQANTGIDFKKDKFYILPPEQLLSGQIDEGTCVRVFRDSNSDRDREAQDEERKGRKSALNVLLCAKTVKTVFEEYVKTQDEVDELTGIYFIPAVLHESGKLSFDSGENKLPWFPREFLQPMAESVLSVGRMEDADGFLSSQVDRIELIRSWSDYVAFFRSFYEAVSSARYDDPAIPNCSDGALPLALEANVYLFIDQTVHSTYHIMKLYNHLLKDRQPKPLYEHFISAQPAVLRPLIGNTGENKRRHSGQMGGEYPLSPSQREAINHFNHMLDGEILAVNGPPGTGKTTLLQSIVADLYVKRALEQRKPPLIVATSTNNQAVTNIIASFGSIKKIGIGNLEERWIEGVNSFAAYFPSSMRTREAAASGYQYTTVRGEYFVADIETAENLASSRRKLLESCGGYFGTAFSRLSDCQVRLHEELLFMEERKRALLDLCKQAEQYAMPEERIDLYLGQLEDEIGTQEQFIAVARQRLAGWQACYKSIPFLFRWSARRFRTEFRLYVSEEELQFLTEKMKFKAIKEVYSQRIDEVNRKLAELRSRHAGVKEWMKRYDEQLDLLAGRGIRVFDESDQSDQRYRIAGDAVNAWIDTKIRYAAFWLAVHYYECRWASGEDSLTEKQFGTTFRNVLEKFYNRLAMVAPCLVMTFYMLPKQFLAYGDQSGFLYQYIDLLIVDEAGQVSPEIAAGALALARKAVVVGDIYQIEPVWGVSRALDKSLALSSGAIRELREYETWTNTGLNGNGSSVMKVAGKSCFYQKHEERGLFLSEHRRCYDEIIEYCNLLVYSGNLTPKRGQGANDPGRALGQWPQMGHRQIDTERSSKLGTSRYNRREGEQIALWLNEHFDHIRSAYPDTPENNLIGVITPFKAQASCIKAEIRKRAPQLLSRISVGTVHTFQGAERNLIILSTVYGRLDGCFFIDANKSLMNVAVSRAKDHFFVFGDLHCFKDTRASASGLLKSFFAAAPFE